MKLNKYILSFCLTALSLGAVMAQQRPQFSQYMINQFLLNPAVAGAYDYADIKVGFREQWAGADFDATPSTFFLSGHFSPTSNKSRPKPTIGTISYYHHPNSNYSKSSLSSSGIKLGLGGTFLYDEQGPISRLMLDLSAALNFPLNDKIRGAVGVQGGWFQHRLNNDELAPRSGSDPIIGSGTDKNNVFNLGAGLFVYQPSKFYLGFSASQLLQNELNYNLAVQSNELLIHYFATGGYQFDLNDRISLIPSTVVKLLEASSVSVDLNGRLAFNLNKGNHIWFGTGYRFDDVGDSIIGLVGGSINNLVNVNFGYDIPIGGFGKLPGGLGSPGNFEITAGIRLPNPGSKQSITDYPHNLF